MSRRRVALLTIHRQVMVQEAMLAEYDLLSSNGEFKDAKLQTKYEAYREKKYKAGETPKDPL